METKEGLLEVIKDVAVIEEFHKLYYNTPKQTWLTTKWKGIFVAKCPLDMWQYQEIIQETQPDIIIETGTWNGGSALFLRDMLRLVGKPQGIVFTLDNNPIGRFKDEDGIVQLIGDSVGKCLVDFVKKSIDIGDKVMVILDSDHSKQHVLNELNTWAPLVSVGCYLIVEDTNVYGHPVYKDHGPGPMEAIKEWMFDNPLEFEHDEWRERFMMTFNPNGYYKRVRE